MLPGNLPRLPKSRLRKSECRMCGEREPNAKQGRERRPTASARTIGLRVGLLATTRSLGNMQVVRLAIPKASKRKTPPHAAPSAPRREPARACGNVEQTSLATTTHVPGKPTGTQPTSRPEATRPGIQRASYSNLVGVGRLAAAGFVYRSSRVLPGKPRTSLLIITLQNHQHRPDADSRGPRRPRGCPPWRHHGVVLWNGGKSRVNKKAGRGAKKFITSCRT